MPASRKKIKAAPVDPSILESHGLPYSKGRVFIRKPRPDKLFEVVIDFEGVDKASLFDGKRRAINFMMDAHSGICAVLHIQHAAAKADDAALCRSRSTGRPASVAAADA